MSSKKLTQDEILKRLEEVHGDKIILLDQYTNRRNKLTFQCSKCNHIWKTTTDCTIRQKEKCPACSKKDTSAGRALSHDEFLKRIKYIHGDNISILSNYSTKSAKVIAQCSKCTHQWNVYAAGLMNGTGCPLCKLSKGERKIDKTLKDANLFYQRQFTFNNLRSNKGHLLPFDFAVFKEDNLEYLIEYDGEQHFISSKFFGGEEKLKKVLLGDMIKDTYCKVNDIKLIRISYNEDITSCLSKVI